MTRLGRRLEQLSLCAHVRALLTVQPYPSAAAVADALGWDATGTDDHARRTHAMVSEALAEVGVFGSDCMWRLRGAT